MSLGPSVATASIADGSVTYAKIQDVSATDKLLGRSTAGSGDVEEIACTAAGRALLDDAAASNQRTTLGLGAAALLADPVPLANGGTGGTTKALAHDAVVYTPVTLITWSTSATAVGATTVAMFNNATTLAGYVVPAGKTLKLLSISASVLTGATVGANYDINAVVRTSAGVNTTLAQMLDQAENTHVKFFVEGTIAAPLMSIAAGTNFRIGWENIAGYTGAHAAGPHWITVTGVLV